MKSSLPPSKNVEVRQREFPRPQGPIAVGGNAIHAADQKKQEAWGKQRIKATLKSKDNSFAPMLKDMDKLPKQLAKDVASKGGADNVPMPTPRPDPSVPYKKPNVWTGD